MPTLQNTLWCHKFPPPLGTSWGLSSRKLLCYSIILDYGNIVGDRSWALPIRCITATTAAATVLQRARWHGPWLPQSSLSASDVMVAIWCLRLLLSLTALCGSTWLCRTFSFLSLLCFKSWGKNTDYVWLVHGFKTHMCWKAILAMSVFFTVDAFWQIQTTKHRSHTYCTFQMSPWELIHSLTLVCYWTNQRGGMIQDCADCDHQYVQKWHSSQVPHPLVDPLPAQIVSGK